MMEVYSDLFSVIGTTYGPGDGSSSFNLPDETPDIYLVEFQVPTTLNGHYYYRLFSDGWLEQGAFTIMPANPSSNTLVTMDCQFAKQMYDGNYSAYLTRIGDPGNTYAYTYRIDVRDSNYCRFAAYSSSPTSGPQLYCWEVKGMSAQGPITNNVNKYIKF